MPVASPIILFPFPCRTVVCLTFGTRQRNIALARSTRGHGRSYPSGHRSAPTPQPLHRPSRSLLGDADRCTASRSPVVCPGESQTGSTARGGDPRRSREHRHSLILWPHDPRMVLLFESAPCTVTEVPPHGTNTRIAYREAFGIGQDPDRVGGAFGLLISVNHVAILPLRFLVPVEPRTTRCLMNNSRHNSRFVLMRQNSQGRICSIKALLQQ